MGPRGGITVLITNIFVNINNRPSAGWRAAAPRMLIQLVNESNVRDFVPDLPEEFFRLPYDQCKSDVLRAAVVYHHGG